MKTNSPRNFVGCLFTNEMTEYTRFCLSSVRILLIKSKFVND